MNILIIGGGGREHAIAWALKKSPKVEKLYCLPGNAGIAEIAHCENILATDFDGILKFLDTHKDINFTVVAPDDPLALGLVNLLESKGYKAFGPTAEAAIIEGSKAFSKNLMKKYNIPTAEYEVFDDAAKAKEYIKTAKYPLVVKADGLALGKGVIICNDIDAAMQAIADIMENKVFGKSGNKVVIEEFLTGFEVSVLAFTDGKTLYPMPSSQDHKRVYDNDQGLNTGGMGTFSPSKKYTDKLAKKANDEIFIPTMQALNSEGRVFKGVIYFGLMIDGENIKVLEYNARFGDPETQSILPKLKTDLVDVMLAIMEERLADIKIEWSDDAAVCVVMASGGYPKEYKKHIPITIGELDDDIIVFHAGTAKKDGQLVTNGGRVLGVTAMGKDIEQAREKAYKNVAKINFEGAHYRKDIGIK